MHRFMNAVFSPLFRVRATGRDRVPLDGPALLACNHQSYLDVVMLGLASPRPVHYVARGGLFRSPLFARVIKSLNAFPLPEDGSRLGAIKETLRRLAEGHLIVIFPEGARSRDGTLQPPKPGVGLLVRRSGVPVIPAAVAGAFEAWPPGRRIPQFGDVWVEFGAPLPASAFRDQSDEAITAAVHRQISGCFATATTRRRRAIGLPLNG
jgi:1-acyl-sn-glycerol-3-phosphate acyltransferase